MSQSLSKIYLHLVFSTKNRENLLYKEIRNEVFRYIGGALSAINCDTIIVGGEIDHVHILFCLPRTLAVADVVKNVKNATSHWYSTRFGRKIQWQNGYGIFSVSQSSVEKVKQYIVNQSEHHRRKTFQEEFREFLKAYGIGFDERYVWD